MNEKELLNRADAIIMRFATITGEFMDTDARFRMDVPNEWMKELLDVHNAISHALRDKA